MFSLNKEGNKLQKKNHKSNIFFTLLCSAAKGATACLVALFLMGVFDSISQKKKLDSKEKLLKAGAAVVPSIEEKISKWK